MTQRSVHGETEVMRRREDRVVGLTLSIGAYLSIIVIIGGLLLDWLTQSGTAVAKLGVLLLICTPAVRIIVAGLVFLREHDRRYALVSLGVLFIVVMTSVAAFLGWVSPLER